MPLSSGLLLWHLKWKPLQSWDLLVMYRQTFHPRLGSGSPPQCPCKGHEPLLPSHIPTPTPALLHRWPSQGLRMGTISILPNRSLPDSFENSLNQSLFTIFSQTPTHCPRLSSAQPRSPILFLVFLLQGACCWAELGLRPPPKTPNNKKDPKTSKSPTPNPRRPRLPQSSMLVTPHI